VRHILANIKLKLEYTLREFKGIISFPILDNHNVKKQVKLARNLSAGFGSMAT
jgi:hypothetical protein